MGASSGNRARDCTRRVPRPSKRTGQRSELGPLGRDERDGASHQLQKTRALKAPADVMAACADVSSRRAGWELPAGDLLERQNQESAPKLSPELLPVPRGAQISSPQPMYLLLEKFAVGRRAVG